MKNRHMVKRYQVNLLTLVLVSTAFIAKAQQVFLPLDHGFNNLVEKDLYQRKDLHTSVRPFSPHETFEVLDSLNAQFQIDRPFTNKWIGKKLLNEHLVDIKDKDYHFFINPLFDFSVGKNLSGNQESTYVNTRGIQASGRFGKQFTFYTDFLENQISFADYIDEYIREHGRNRTIVPGQGTTKLFKSQSDKRDFGISHGAINLKLNQFFDFQFGYGKQFIGDGYRSMILSDNAFNYPYLRIITKFWKLQYTNLYSKTRDLRYLYPDGTYLRKYTAAHHLSYNVNSQLNVGIFEAVTYADSLGTRGLDWEFMVPIIFYRPAEIGVGSKGGNVLLGLTTYYKPSDRLVFYGQLAIDEFTFSEFRAQDGWWGNKFSWQLGSKIFDLMPNLNAQVEFNSARPYTYAHRNQFQGFAHYNEALAHPLGANFWEALVILRYYRQRWYLNGSLFYQVLGKDAPGSNWGSDPFLSYQSRERENGNEIGQGIRTTQLSLMCKLGYLLNPNTNMRLELSLLSRNLAVPADQQFIAADNTLLFQIGLSTQLHNLYYDF